MVLSRQISLWLITLDQIGIKGCRRAGVDGPGQFLVSCISGVGRYVGNEGRMEYISWVERYL